MAPVDGRSTRSVFGATLCPGLPTKIVVACGCPLVVPVALGVCVRSRPQQTDTRSRELIGTPLGNRDPAHRSSTNTSNDVPRARGSSRQLQGTSHGASRTTLSPGSAIADCAASRSRRPRLNQGVPWSDEVLPTKAKTGSTRDAPVGRSCGHVPSGEARWWPKTPVTSMRSPR
jgi:hypothetical protein